MTLEEAIAFAARKHAGQLDKAGAPYVLHPLRVMLRCEGLPARRVAVLHDVVEDCGVSPDELRRLGLPEEEIAAVLALSKKPDGETYEAFIERLAPNPLAREVKLADLADNLDLSRLDVLRPEDAARIVRYHAAVRRLRSAC